MKIRDRFENGAPQRMSAKFGTDHYASIEAKLVDSASWETYTVTATALTYTITSRLISADEIEGEAEKLVKAIEQLSS